MTYLYNRTGKNDKLDCGLLAHLNANRYYKNETIDYKHKSYQQLLTFYRTNEGKYGREIKRNIIFDCNISKLFGLHAISTIPDIYSDKDIHLLYSQIQDYNNKRVQREYVNRIKNAIIDNKNICICVITTSSAIKKASRTHKLDKTHCVLITNYKLDKLRVVNIPTNIYKNSKSKYRYCEKYIDFSSSYYKILYAIEISNHK